MKRRAAPSSRICWSCIRPCFFNHPPLNLSFSYRRWPFSSSRGRQSDVVVVVLSTGGRLPPDASVLPAEAHRNIHRRFDHVRLRRSSRQTTSLSDISTHTVIYRRRRSLHYQPKCRGRPHLIERLVHLGSQRYFEFNITERKLSRVY